MRRDRLAQPQRRSQIDLDHQPQHVRSRSERVSWTEGSDGIHQDVGGPDLAGDPVDEAFRRGGVGGVGHLGTDRFREVAQRMLVPVDRHHGEAAGGEGQRRRVTKRAACTGHDRHLCAHGLRVTTKQVRGRHRILVIRSGAKVPVLRHRS
jgi:hypothetical protein